MLFYISTKCLIFVSAISVYGRRKVQKLIYLNQNKFIFIKLYEHTRKVTHAYTQTHIYRERETEKDRDRQRHRERSQKVDSGFSATLTYHSMKRADSKRNIIWFSQPQNTIITDVGKILIKIIYKNFTKSSIIHKIFNRNTLNDSYSCIENMTDNKKTKQKNNLSHQSNKHLTAEQFLETD